MTPRHHVKVNMSVVKGGQFTMHILLGIHLPSIGILIVHMRRQHTLLTNTIWFPILVRQSRYKETGLWFNIRKSHCGDKTVVRSSYLHNGISYTGKMSSLYWIRAQFSISYIMRISLYADHWQLDCLINYSIKITPKTSSRFCIGGQLWGESTKGQ